MNSQISHQPIATERIDVENKTFYIDLKENARGRYFKITEEVRGRRNTIIVPAEAVHEAIVALRRLGEFEEQLA